MVEAWGGLAPDPGCCCAVRHQDGTPREPGVVQDSERPSYS